MYNQNPPGLTNTGAGGGPSPPGLSLNPQVHNQYMNNHSVAQQAAAQAQAQVQARNQQMTQNYHAQQQQIQRAAAVAANQAQQQVHVQNQQQQQNQQAQVSDRSPLGMRGRGPSPGGGGQVQQVPGNPLQVQTQQQQQQLQQQTVNQMSNRIPSIFFTGYTDDTRPGAFIVQLLFSDLFKENRNMHLNIRLQQIPKPQNQEQEQSYINQRNFLIQSYCELLVKDMVGMVRKLSFMSACVVLQEMGSRVEEVQNLMQNAKTISKLYLMQNALMQNAKTITHIIYALGDILCNAASKEPDPVCQAKPSSTSSSTNVFRKNVLNPNFASHVLGVDRAFLRLIESILMIYETDYESLSVFIQKCLKHRIIPTFALRRMVSANSFCISAMKRIETLQQTKMQQQQQQSNINNTSSSVTNEFFRKYPQKPETLIEMVVPSKKCVKIKEIILQKLRSIIQDPSFYKPPANAKFPSGIVNPQKNGKNGLEVELYGSAVNGFETKDSDIDCTIILPDIQQQVQPQQQSQNGIGSNVQSNSIDSAALALQHFNVREKCSMLRQILPKHGFQAVQVIEARIPLVKCRAQDGNFLDLKDEKTGSLQKGIAIDISINNILGYENSKLLKSYSSSPCCRGLGLLVKSWAKHRGIIDAQNGMLSSYVYMLMVIFFLQHKKGLLPSLQQMFGKNDKSQKRTFYQVHDVSFEKNWKGNEIGKNLPLGKLLQEFFAYYSEEFNWYRDVVSIRLAKPISKMKLIHSLYIEYEEERSLAQLQQASQQSTSTSSSQGLKWNCPLFIGTSAQENGAKWNPRSVGLLIEDPFEFGQIKSGTFLSLERLCYEFQRAHCILSETQYQYMERGLLDWNYQEECVENKKLKRDQTKKDSEGPDSQSESESSDYLSKLFGPEVDPLLALLGVPSYEVAAETASLEAADQQQSLSQAQAQKTNCFSDHAVANMLFTSGFLKRATKDEIEHYEQKQLQAKMVQQQQALQSAQQSQNASAPHSNLIIGTGLLGTTQTAGATENLNLSTNPSAKNSDVHQILTKNGIGNGSDSSPKVKNKDGHELTPRQQLLEQLGALNNATTAAMSPKTSAGSSDSQNQQTQNGVTSSTTQENGANTKELTNGTSTSSNTSNNGTNDGPDIKITNGTNPSPQTVVQIPPLLTKQFEQNIRSNPGSPKIQPQSTSAVDKQGHALQAFPPPIIMYDSLDDELKNSDAFFKNIQSLSIKVLGKPTASSSNLTGLSTLNLNGLNNIQGFSLTNGVNVSNNVTTAGTGITATGTTNPLSLNLTGINQAGGLPITASPGTAHSLFVRPGEKNLNTTTQTTTNGNTSSSNYARAGSPLQKAVMEKLEAEAKALKMQQEKNSNTSLGGVPGSNNNSDMIQNQIQNLNNEKSNQSLQSQVNSAPNSATNSPLKTALNSTKEELQNQINQLASEAGAKIGPTSTVTSTSDRLPPQPNSARSHHDSYNPIAKSSNRKLNALLKDSISARLSETLGNSTALEQGLVHHQLEGEVHNHHHGHHGHHGHPHKIHHRGGSDEGINTINDQVNLVNLSRDNSHGLGPGSHDSNLDLTSPMAGDLAVTNPTSQMMQSVLQKKISSNSNQNSQIGQTSPVKLSNRDVDNHNDHESQLESAEALQQQAAMFAIDSKFAQGFGNLAMMRDSEGGSGSLHSNIDSNISSSQTQAWANVGGGWGNIGKPSLTESEGVQDTSSGQQQQSNSFRAPPGLQLPQGADDYNAQNIVIDNENDPDESDKSPTSQLEVPGPPPYSQLLDESQTMDQENEQNQAANFGYLDNLMGLNYDGAGSNHQYTESNVSVTSLDSQSLKQWNSQASQDNDNQNQNLMEINVLQVTNNIDIEQNTNSFNKPLSNPIPGNNDQTSAPNSPHSQTHLNPPEEETQSNMGTEEPSEIDQDEGNDGTEGGPGTALTKNQRKKQRKKDNKNQQKGEKGKGSKGKESSKDKDNSKDSKDKDNESSKTNEAIPPEPLPIPDSEEVIPGPPPLEDHQSETNSTPMSGKGGQGAQTNGAKNKPKKPGRKFQ